MTTSPRMIPIEVLRSIVDFAYQQGYHELGYDIVKDVETEITTLNERLERINMLACYASEEDTSAQPAALLEIGKLARKEIAP
jgi:hypothetical protein